MIFPLWHLFMFVGCVFHWKHSTYFTESSNFTGRVMKRAVLLSYPFPTLQRLSLSTFLADCHICKNMVIKKHSYIAASIFFNFRLWLWLSTVKDEAWPLSHRRATPSKRCWKQTHAHTCTRTHTDSLFLL